MATSSERTSSGAVSHEKKIFLTKVVSFDTNSVTDFLGFFFIISRLPWDLLVGTAESLGKKQELLRLSLVFHNLCRQCWRKVDANLQKHLFFPLVVALLSLAFGRKKKTHMERFVIELERKIFWDGCKCEACCRYIIYEDWFLAFFARERFPLRFWIGGNVLSRSMQMWTWEITLLRKMAPCIFLLSRKTVEFFGNKNCAITFSRPLHFRGWVIRSC